MIMMIIIIVIFFSDNDPDYAPTKMQVASLLNEATAK